MAASQDTEKAEDASDQSLASSKTEEENSNNAKAAQLLGIRGASQEDNIWKIRLQLTKPVTWVPLIWGESPRPISHKGHPLPQVWFAEPQRLETLSGMSTMLPNPSSR